MGQKKRNPLERARRSALSFPLSGLQDATWGRFRSVGLVLHPGSQGTGTGRRETKVTLLLSRILLEKLAKKKRLTPC